MGTPTWIIRLRAKWNLKNTTQVVLVLLVFACTGITVLIIKAPILNLLGAQENRKLASVLYFIFILPVYNIILLLFGFIFGQFAFFWEFEKKFIRRLVSVLKRK